MFLCLNRREQLKDIGRWREAGERGVEAETKFLIIKHFSGFDVTLDESTY